MLYVFLMIFYTLVCIGLVGIVLLQSGKDAGFAGAFGAGGGSDTVFGAQRGNILTKATIVGVTIFMLLSFVLSKMTSSGPTTGTGLSTIDDTPIPVEAPVSPGGGSGDGVDE